MKFEYDPQKSQGNSQKHGIDFEEANSSGMTKIAWRSLPEQRMNPVTWLLARLKASSGRQ